jgi:nitrite reductase/ring-hydroxylating ferredoxin subunit
MVVVTFKASGADNCVTVAGTPYMYARTEHGSFVLPVRCPHRNGPLNLATMQPGATRLVCPWHERATSVTRAISKGIPAVRSGENVTTVLSSAEDSTCEWDHRPVSLAISQKAC